MKSEEKGDRTRREKGAYLVSRELPNELMRLKAHQNCHVERPLSAASWWFVLSALLLCIDCGKAEVFAIIIPSVL